MTAAKSAAPQPPHPVYQYLVGKKFLSVEDRDRFKRARYVTVQFVRDEKRIHDRKKRPYAHTISVVTSAGDYAGAQLIGRKKTSVVSVARLLKTALYELVDERPEDPGVTREQVERHQVSDGNGGELPRCSGDHQGPCHETPMPPSERAAPEPGEDHPIIPAEECPA